MNFSTLMKMFYIFINVCVSAHTVPSPEAQVSAPSHLPRGLVGTGVPVQGGRRSGEASWRRLLWSETLSCPRT